MRQYRIYKSGLLIGTAQSDARGDWLNHAERFFEIGGAADILPTPLDFDVQKVLARIFAVNARPTAEWEQALLEVGTHYLYCANDEMLYEQTDGFPLDLVVHEGRIIGCVAPRREHCAVICEPGYEEFTPLAIWKDIHYSDRLIRKRSISIPMRDGVLLSTDVYMHAGGEEPRPTILIRTPYGKERMAAEEWRFVKLGYALVVQDVRGRFGSQGEWIPFHSEIEDGYDTLAFLSAQPWCDGNIGMIGASYGGYTQMCAAVSGHSSLKAMVSIVTAGGPFNDVPRRGGAFLSGFMAWGCAVADKETRAERMIRDDWAQILSHKPIREIPAMLVEGGIPFFDEWFTHETYDAFWQKDDWTLHGANIRIPTLYLGGFFDDNIYGTTQGYGFTRANGVPHRLIIGAWGHNLNTRRQLNGFDMGNHALRYDLDLQFVRWMGQWLRGEEAQSVDNPVEFYDFRLRAWHSANSLPLAESRSYKLYLGEGLLSKSTMEVGCIDYVYDPANPTPSMIDPSENEMNMIADYARIDCRPDVACFDSDQFPQKALLTGESKVTLYVASDCPDTDFVTRLSLLTQDGHSIKLAENLVRAKLRNGFVKAELLVPDEIVRIEVPLQLVGVTVDRGERLRLCVCSAARNLIFPNGNTGEDLEREATQRVAHNRILFGGDYPSAIEVRIGGSV